MKRMAALRRATMKAQEMGEDGAAEDVGAEPSWISQLSAMRPAVIAMRRALAINRSRRSAWKLSARRECLTRSEDKFPRDEDDADVWRESLDHGVCGLRVVAGEVDGCKMVRGRQ